VPWIDVDTPADREAAEGLIFAGAGRPAVP
jgi:hypothetical protein